ncbi:MAG TPA: LysR substrate-binding domain-containing protein [Aliidongia sp.]|uniref:LysR substrate-binding domain-containing protein n=1 Tax=Aliidongia sp. TaxID=1914230 RepID=UPI002DDD5BF4|nr:LysR substrate-binding domain-containing protein [Aliidongia sp.]HEV2676998.1 LysR substrate-binding domain-containing protein [Aliidongia sp.]
MAPRIPSIETLRAFDAAVRLGSFSRAAEAVHLTHGAVSRRIAALEVDLDVRLFDRLPRGVRTTEAGLQLHKLVAHTLEQLRAGLADLKSGGRPVRISVLPSFASRWLLPRLGLFRAAEPGIEVEMTAQHEFAEVGRGGVDLAVRYGTAPWRGVRSELLFKERLFPIGRPGQMLASADDLVDVTLLHDSRHEDWIAWLAAAGWPMPARHQVFNDYNLVLEAAASGLGLALGRSRVIEPDLASGRLARLHPLSVANVRAYHLVTPEPPLGDEVARLAAWLRETAAREARL